MAQIAFAEHHDMIEAFPADRALSHPAVEHHDLITLNVLPSFAELEREVTSERIRDKIAASKRKGPWVGGPLPLGYAMKSSGERSRIPRRLLSANTVASAQST
jgi:DNA invertase Pin-like site-specific DNA recombinase